MASKFRRSYSYLDEHGNVQSIVITGQSQKEADHHFQTFIENKIGKNKYSTPTVKEFVDETYRNVFMCGLKPTTRVNYELFLELNIIPFMGNMRMNEVTVATVQEFMQWMATAKERGRKKNLNASTITRVCGFASRIFKVAKEMHIIDDIPFKMVLLRNPGETASHHKALSDKDVARIKQQIPFLKNEQERLYMALLVYTGMRKSEVLGMRWENLHLEDQYGEVTIGVTYPNNNKPHIDTTKTSYSERAVLLPKPLIDILKPLTKPSGFVLGGDSPLCYSTAVRIRQRAFKALDIHGFDNHDFRTTYGTQLKESGVTSAIIADLLGHADTRMVETVYAKRRDTEVLKYLDAVEKINHTCTGKH